MDREFIVKVDLTENEERYLIEKIRETCRDWFSEEPLILEKSAALLRQQGQEPLIQQLSKMLESEQQLNKQSEHFSVKESTANRMYCLRTVIDMVKATPTT